MKGSIDTAVRQESIIEECDSKEIGGTSRARGEAHK